MANLVQFLQEKLEAIAPGRYVVSNERNIESDFSKSEVVVSALSGPIYKESSSIPYQIDITTNDIDAVMVDFTTLAKNENEQPYTTITGSGNDFKSETIVPFFNSPVVFDKDLVMGSDHYARIVVFAMVGETQNTNNIKSLKIDGEQIELLNGSFIYVVESVSNRVSGQELNKGKKKAASCSVSFNAINKASVFYNKAFKISSGQLPGNTSFSVELKLENNLSATLVMFLNSYTMSAERTKLPAVNVGLMLYDNRGDNNA